MSFNIFAPISLQNKIYSNVQISRQRNDLNDPRRVVVWQKIIEEMVNKRSTVVQCLAKNQKEADQMYHFMNNEKIEVEELIRMNCRANTKSISGKQVFIIGDSSSIYLGKSGRIKDIEKVGVLTGGKVPGFHMHVNIAISEQFDILGLSDIIYWTRRAKKGLKEGEQAGVDKRTKDERESIRWSMGVKNSKESYGQASQRTYIFDQEADHFDLKWRIVEQEKEGFIIRGNRDREIEWNGKTTSVESCMRVSKLKGTYEVDLRSLNHHSRTFGKLIKRKARKATIEVRYEKVTLLESIKSRGKKNRRKLPLYLVEAREVIEGLEDGEKPILWRIWTTHPVESYEDAVKIINLYSKRWIVEQFFRTLKQKGLKIEETQFETFAAILKQTTLAMHAAIKILQLVYARDRMNSQPIGDVFDEKEQKVLSKVNQRMEGDTEKQKNPYSSQQLSWASWIIGRLGGWKGYSSQSSPGPITMLRGLQKFASYVEAYNFFNTD